MPVFSFIIPVFNRPDELNELLESLTTQTVEPNTFEVIVVEDGSQITSKEVCNAFKYKLNLKYFEKENSGPGLSRNFGAEKAQGQYLIILDSDVVLPKQYLQNVVKELNTNECDAFGGPDLAHVDFTPIQKAISYSMTSFLTTGGIRGGKKKLDKFYPRSYNMGIKKEVYNALGGFSNMRFGEDIDFSIRIFKNNYSCRLFPEAWVWHKRRTDFKKFFKQVYNSGIARINLYKKYPESLKLVHCLPTIFTLGCLILIALSVALLNPIPLALIVIFAFLIFADTTAYYKSIKIGALAIIAAFTQLTGYGLGFIYAWWRRCVRRKNEFEAFKNSFYE